MKPKSQDLSRVNISYSAYKPTSDDWHPNFPDDYVKIKLTSLSNGYFRVLVRGADDFGYEIDFAVYNFALNKFLKVLSLNNIRKKNIRGLGFKNMI